MSLKISTLWNFADSVQATASSEAIDHPASNLLVPSRAKTWRSDGLFVITAGSNDKLDFDDGGGEFNASLTAGKYSVSQLETEIKTQMEVVGGETYTVTYSYSTGKWTISSSGGTFNILWSSGTNSTDSVGTDIGFDVSVDDSTSTSYTGASIAIHTEEYATIDLGTWGTNAVDTIAVFFDPELGPKFSPQAQLTIEANQTPNFTAPAFSMAVTVDDDFSVITTFLASSESYRYWRFKIVDPKNPDLYVELPTFLLGEYYSISQNAEVGFKETMTDRTDIQTNDFGNEYFDILPIRRRMDFNWKHLTENDKLLFKQLYYSLGRSKPLMMVIDPQEMVFQNKDDSAIYARIDNTYETAQTAFTYFDFSMTVREVF